jgi:HK97 family phage prohead protease
VRQRRTPATQRKTYSAVVKNDGGDRRLTFTISTGTLDRDKDRIDPGGWATTAYADNPIVLWAHKYDQPPVAKTVALHKGLTGLVATAEFAETAFASDVFDLYRGGFLRAVSVGFIPLEREPNEFGGFDIKAAELLEFSCVAVPSNPEALVQLAAKGLALERPPHDVDDLVEQALRILGIEPVEPDPVEFVLQNPEALATLVGEAVDGAMRRMAGRLD